MASRQLRCPTCAEAMRLIGQRPHIVAAGETVRIVFGTCRGQGLQCDGCGQPFSVGVRCAAVTVLARDEQLGPWEAQYVDAEVTS